MLMGNLEAWKGRGGNLATWGCLLSGRYTPLASPPPVAWRGAWEKVLKVVLRPKLKALGLVVAGKEVTGSRLSHLSSFLLPAASVAVEKYTIFNLIEFDIQYSIINFPYSG